MLKQDPNTSSRDSQSEIEVVEGGPLPVGFQVPIVSNENKLEKEKENEKEKEIEIEKNNDLVVDQLKEIIAAAPTKKQADLPEIFTSYDADTEDDEIEAHLLEQPDNHHRYTGNWHTQLNWVYVGLVTTVMVGLALAEYLKIIFKDDEPVFLDFPLIPIIISSAIALLAGPSDAYVTRLINSSREDSERDVEKLKDFSKDKLTVKEYVPLTGYSIAKIVNRSARALFFFKLIGVDNPRTEVVSIFAGFTVMTLIRNARNSFLELIDSSNYDLDDERKRTESDYLVKINALFEALCAFSSNYPVSRGIFTLVFLLISIWMGGPLENASQYAIAPGVILALLNATGATCAHATMSASLAAGEKNRAYNNTDGAPGKKKLNCFADLLLNIILGGDFSDHAADALLLFTYISSKFGYDLFYSDVSEVTGMAIGMRLGTVIAASGGAYFFTYPQFRACLNEVTATANQIEAAEHHDDPQDFFSKVKGGPPANIRFN